MTPLSTLAVGFSVAVGIEFLADHVLVAGSYASTVVTGTVGVAGRRPPNAYRRPFKDATAMAPRLLGTGAFVDHVSATGSYASTSPSYCAPCPDVPPIAYRLPLTTLTTG